MMSRWTYAYGMKGVLVLVVLFTILLLFTGCTDWFHYALTIEKEGEGEVEPPVGHHPHFYRNSTVHLQAIPSNGWKFSSWEGDVLDQYKAKTTIFLDEDKVVKAVFVEER